MPAATYRHEAKLLRDGFERIAGLDEVGKGAWAGPLVAAAVILPPDARLTGLRDSKQLSATGRKQLYLDIVKHAANWSIGVVSEQTIDQIGIVRANERAMERAINRLTIQPDYLLIDYLRLSNVSIPADSITNGDQKVASIAAASIVAKVIRDYMMVAFHRDWPQYGFHRHKGYGTEEHHERIIQYGLCALHRRSFAPMNGIGRVSK